MANKKVSIIKGVDGVSYDIDALTLSGKTYAEIVELINAATNGAVVLKGTLGTGGTVTTLETAAAANCGHAYKVIADGTYASQAAKVGDLFICYKSGTSSYAWMLIPAGDDLDDTWRPVKVNGTQAIANGITSGALNLKSGNNIEVTASGNDVTFNLVNELPNARLPRRLQEYSSSGYSDANEATMQGWHYMTSTATNRPPFKQVDGVTGNDYRIMTTAYSSAWVQQIATDFRSNDIFTRNSINGSWQPWTAVVKLQRCGTDHSMPTITDNAIPRWDTTRNATLQNSGIIIDDSNNITVPGKVVQGTKNTDTTITNMNQFTSDLYVKGDGSAPDTPKIAGFYLGKSNADENRHMDIVTGATVSYIDFNRAGTVRDFDFRFRVNNDSGNVLMQWNAGYSASAKLFKIDGGILEATTIKKTGGADTHVLLAGGGTKALSEFALGGNIQVKSGDILSITDNELSTTYSITTSVAVGNLAKGTTVNGSVKDLLDLVFGTPTKVSNLTLTAAAGSFEKGTTKSLTKAVVKVEKGTAKKLDKLEIKSGSTVLASTTSVVEGNNTITIPSTTITSDTTITALLTYDTNNSKSTTANYSFFFYSYYGAVASNVSVDSITYTSLSKKNGTSSLKITMSNQCAVLAIPGTATTIKDENNFDCTGNFSKTTKTITNSLGASTSYTVFKLITPVSGTKTYTVS